MQRFDCFIHLMLVKQLLRHEIFSTFKQKSFLWLHKAAKNAQNIINELINSLDEEKPKFFLEIKAQSSCETGIKF